MRSATPKKSQVIQQSSYGSTCGEWESQSRSAGEGSENGYTAPRQVYEPPTVGKREEANVLLARGLVAIILLFAVIGVATTANWFAKKQERSDFENKFARYATEILATLVSKSNHMFGALDSFASSIGAQAAAEHALSNTSWPFYRIPHWSVQAQRLAQLSRVDNTFIGVAPIVEEDEREEWNRFAAEQNPLWYQESIENEG
eukprot:scaffold3044_cov103-Cylindrotheca_fusiformis.AAC.3